MVRISEIKWFLFSWAFLYHLPQFPNFRKFWLDGKRPLLMSVQPRSGVEFAIGEGKVITLITIPLSFWVLQGVIRGLCQSSS